MKNIGFGPHGRSRGPVRDEIIELQKLSNAKYKFRSPRPEPWTGPNQKIDHFNNALNFKQKSSELMTGVGGRSDTKNRLILERISMKNQNFGVCGRSRGQAQS